MKIPFINAHGQITEILDSKDLTPEEWELVKKNKSGALAANDLPNGVREPR